MREDETSDSKAKPPLIRFRKTPDDVIRDKDNAKPVPAPPLGARHPPNLAPGGSLGIKRDLVPQQAPVSPQRPSAGLSVDIDPQNQTGWIEGRIVTMPGYTFHAKIYDEPSKFGINGGMISKLDVRKDDQLVMRYDRGWDKDPSTPEDREALQRIRNGLGDLPKDQDKAKSQEQSKDHAKGWDFDR